MRVLVPLLLLAAAAPAQERVTDYFRLLEAGRRHFRAHEYARAADVFLRARAVQPLDWRGHTWHAVTLVQQAFLADEADPGRAALLDRAGAASSELVKRCKIAFSDPLYQYLRGILQAARGRDAAAFATLRKSARHGRAAYARYERDFPLEVNAKRAYAKAALRLATRLIAVGEMQQADGYLGEADRDLPADDPARLELARLRGVAAEFLGRIDEAVGHLRKGVALAPEGSELREELTASIVMILVAAEKLDDARAALETLPADCDHPDVLVARGYLHHKLAMRDPDSDEMDRALAYLRGVLPKLAERGVHRLAVPFADLVLEKIGPRELERGRALVEEALRYVETEQSKRPECPDPYYALYRLHRLLGHAGQAEHFRKLHAQKKKEWEKKTKYDSRGRPRCR